MIEKRREIARRIECRDRPAGPGQMLNWEIVEAPIQIIDFRNAPKSASPVHLVTGKLNKKPILSRSRGGLKRRHGCMGRYTHLVTVSNHWSALFPRERRNQMGSFAFSLQKRFDVIGRGGTPRSAIPEIPARLAGAD